MTHINFEFLEEEKTMFGSAVRMLALQKSNGTIEKDYQMHFRSGPLGFSFLLFLDFLLTFVQNFLFSSFLRVFLPNSFKQFRFRKQVVNTEREHPPIIMGIKELAFSIILAVESHLSEPFQNHSGNGSCFSFYNSTNNTVTNIMPT